MLDAHKRRFDVVAVWKFDRFARSVSHLLRALDTFRVLGIEFVSLSESLDTATPAGRMVFTVLGAVAELERSLIAERVTGRVAKCASKGQEARTAPVSCGCFNGCRFALTRARMEEDRRPVRGGRWHALPLVPGRFQNSGKGYLNPDSISAWV